VLLNAEYVPCLLARPQIRVQILKPDMGCFKSQLPPSFLAHEEKDCYFFFLILFLFYTLITLQAARVRPSHVATFSSKSTRGLLSSRPQQAWGCASGRQGWPRLVPASGTPDTARLVRPNTSGYRITESQNSRGWKGPLWVI